MSLDARQYAPATQSNRQPILAILKRILAQKADILEIASGTGQHAVYFAQQCPSWHWYPSDQSPICRDSIRAWSQFLSVDNIHPPLDIDATQPFWDIEAQDIQIDAIVNINMIHISSWSACLGLMAGAKRILPPGGILYLYGAFKRDGVHTAPSNEAFDLSLKSRNPEWGVRNLEEVWQVAKSQSLDLQEIIEMPNNNLSVIWRKS